MSNEICRIEVFCTAGAKGTSSTLFLYGKHYSRHATSNWQQEMARKPWIHALGMDVHSHDQSSILALTMIAVVLKTTFPCLY